MSFSTYLHRFQSKRDFINIYQRRWRDIIGHKTPYIRTSLEDIDRGMCPCLFARPIIASLCFQNGVVTVRACVQLVPINGDDNGVYMFQRLGRPTCLDNRLWMDFRDALASPHLPLIANSSAILSGIEGWVERSLEAIRIHASAD